MAAALITASAADGLVPSEIADLSSLRTVGATGSPLSPDGFAWVYETVSKDLVVTSISGGTDVCTPFVCGSPTLPVRAGQIATRALGCAVAVFDDDGRPVTDQVGELVVTAPMPSMPLFLWGDTDGRRYHDSYFDVFPGVWRHGDWARITDDGAVVVQGRSDATLNRGGVRIGTAELYSLVEKLPGITDSLVIDVLPRGSTGKVSGELVLFVVLDEGATLTADLAAAIKAIVREQLSPRHVPDRVVQIGEVPRTHNGKKLEVPVKRLMGGEPLEAAVSLAAVANPESLLPFVQTTTTAP